MIPDRRRTRVVAVTAAAGAAGVVTVVLAVLLGPAPEQSAPVVLAFAVVLLVAQLQPLHLTHEGDSEALRLEEVLLVPMALLLAPSRTLAVFALCVGVANLVLRRGWLKTVFNTGVVTVSAGAGLLVAHLAGVRDDARPRALLAAVLAGLVYCVVSAACVAGVIAVAQARPWWDVLREGARVRMATWAGSLSLGLLVAAAAVEQPGAVLVAIVPAVVMQWAYSRALRQWHERRRAAALYDAARRLHASVSTEDVHTSLAAAARELLSAGSARVVPDHAEPEEPGALRAPVTPGRSLEVARPATGGPWTEDDRTRLQALAAVAAGALENARLFEQVRAITRSLGEGVLALDDAGVVTFANPAAERLLGWAPGRLEGRAIARAVDRAVRRRADGAEEWVHLPRLRAGETVRLDEHVMQRADGTPVDVALTASPVLHEGEVVGAVVVFRDVTERKALERRLVLQAFSDPLTGLANRALFLDRLEHARLRSRDDEQRQAVLFVDLDRFKMINDSLGHRVGDDVLCTVAARLLAVLREGDTVARFGGDEFTVLLEGLASTEEATAAAERIVAAVRRPMTAGDRQLVLSASVGVAVSEPGRPTGDLLAAADIAMHDAKSAGKDRWSLAAADADDRALARLDLEMELRRALAEGELELHYQPVVHAEGGGLYGLEALVRWRHPTLGLLAPGAFMDMAEDTGLVLPLGEWVLEQACRDGRAWHDRHPGSVPLFAVNLSGRQFQQPDLRQRIADVLARTGFDPARLVLEITETVLMSDTETVMSTLDGLRSLHVQLAVDDFGTGFSSLSYLKRFVLDTIKIDKSFVEGLGTSTVDGEIVASVVRVADAAGMQTVAEGVETAPQLQQLRRLGCSAVQGFLVAAPQPLADVERLLIDLTEPDPQTTGPGSARA